MTERPTPIVDAAERTLQFASEFELGNYFVDSSFARTLERDRLELMEALRELLSDCDADLKPTKKHPARALLARLEG